MGSKLLAEPGSSLLSLAGHLSYSDAAELPGSVHWPPPSHAPLPQHTPLGQWELLGGIRTSALNLPLFPTNPGPVNTGVTEGQSQLAR